MGKKIVTPNQEEFLSFFANQPSLAGNFYFTGGTALAKFYLQHRFSEDLDFFSEKEFEASEVTPYIYQAQERLGFKKFDYQQSFNRHIFHLIFSSKKSLKIEFTYFPFPQIEKPMKREGVLIDSLMDIAVNKVFTISQKSRGRDFFDLYIILKKEKWDIFDLLKKARIKFDWHIDWLQFGSQLLKIIELKDDPIIKNKLIKIEEINQFFINLSKKISNKVLEKQ